MTVGHKDILKAVKSQHILSQKNNLFGEKAKKMLKSGIKKRVIRYVRCACRNDKMRHPRGVSALMLALPATDSGRK